MRHKPIPVLSRRIFNILDMRHVCLCGLSCRFQQLSPLTGAGCLCITHPFATQCRSIASDLHVLGTPPAFILSQDQTLHCPFLSSDNFMSSWLFLFSYLYWRVYCSVFNVPVPSRRVLIYNTIYPLPLQVFFLLFFVFLFNPLFSLFITSLII